MRNPVYVVVRLGVLPGTREVFTGTYLTLGIVHGHPTNEGLVVHRTRYRMYTPIRAR